MNINSTSIRVSTIVKNYQMKPGRKSDISDNMLSAQELCRKEIIRKRNKEAAKRLRSRRIEKMANLEEKLKKVEAEKDALAQDNRLLRCLLMSKKQINQQFQENSGPQLFRSISNTEIELEKFTDFKEIFQPTQETTTKTKFDVYPNATGALLVNSLGTFMINPIRHHLQLTIQQEPSQPNSVSELNEILNSLPN